MKLIKGERGIMNTLQWLVVKVRELLANKDSSSGGGGTTGDYIPLTEILYADLKTIRDNGELIPGMQYRITDYVTTTVQQDTQSAGHQFDIIVTADSASVLNEDARAALHNGDTYFADAKLESWKLKYCIDNDTSRFSWADETNGKGVIHLMIDDKGNSLFYDFKNIQFKRYKITAVSNSGLEETYLNTYMGLESNSVLTIDINDFIWVYTFNTEYSSDTEDDSLNNIYCRKNVIGKLFMNNNLLVLSNNTFGNTVYSNTFGDYVFYNTFGNSISSNTFGNEATSNTFGDYVFYNTFGNNTESNTFGNTVYSNTFGNYVSSNTFGNTVYSNTFGNTVSYNTFGNSIFFNTFGNEVTSNTFGDYVEGNIFGNQIYDNTFETGVNHNTFGNTVYSNTFGNYVSYNTFGNSISFNTFGNGSTGEYFQYNRVENGCSGPGSPKDWTTQTALYGNDKFYSVQIFGQKAVDLVTTTNTWQYYDTTGTLVKGTW